MLDDQTNQSQKITAQVTPSAILKSLVRLGGIRVKLVHALSRRCDLVVPEVCLLGA